MKNFGLILVLCAISFSGVISQKEGLANRRNFIEDIIIRRINNGIRQINDPLLIMDQNIALDNRYIRGTLNVTNAQVTGHSGTDISSISVNVATRALSMTLRIPQLDVDFDYVATILLSKIIPFFGRGSSSITFIDVDLSVTGVVNVINIREIRVQDISVLVKIGSAKFDINGIYHNRILDRIINHILNNYFVSFINRHSELFSKIIGPILENILNGIPI